MNTFIAYECPNRFFKDESLLPLIASFLTTIKVSGIYHPSVDDLRLSSSPGPRYPYIIGLVARHMYNGISNTTYSLVTRPGYFLVGLACKRGVAGLGTNGAITALFIFIRNRRARILPVVKSA